MRLLFPDTQGFDYCPVAFDINHLQIIELFAALTDQAQQRALCPVVMPVLFQRLCKVVDTVGK